MKSREVRQTEALERAAHRWDAFKSDHGDTSVNRAWWDKWMALGGREAYLNQFRPARLKAAVELPKKKEAKEAKP